jgi:hypothetical protein
MGAGMGRDRVTEKNGKGETGHFGQPFGAA